MVAEAKQDATFNAAKQLYAEQFGDAIVTNTYLKIALVLVSLVAVGLLGLNFHTVARYSQVKPLVVRIDQVGRVTRHKAPAGRLGERTV